jgi:hypothetical protein
MRRVSAATTIATVITTATMIGTTIATKNLRKAALILVYLNSGGCVSLRLS